jgi:hypothetical protein
MQALRDHECFWRRARETGAARLPSLCHDEAETFLNDGRITFSHAAKIEEPLPLCSNTCGTAFDWLSRIMPLH